jgi:hypothetical protein
MTPLFKKLNYKNQDSILVLNAPASFEVELKSMSMLTTIIKNVSDISKIDFAMIFVTQQKEIDNSIKQIFNKLNGDAVLRYCYPKGTSKKYKCDFNRDTGWSAVGKYNLEGVRMVAIDEDWSALRFRKIEFIKSMTRNESIAISTEGKKRSKVNPGN